MNEDVQKFKNLISKWSTYYTRIKWTYIEIKHEEQNLLLTGRLSLEVEKFVPKKDECFETKNLAFGTMYKEIKGNIDDVIDEVSRGEFCVQKEKFRIHDEDDKLSAYLLPYHVDKRTSLRNPIARVTGNNHWNVKNKCEVSDDEINWGLKSCNRPFSNLNEVYHFLGMEDLRQDSSLIEIVAKSPISIKGCEINSDKEMVVELCAAKEIDDSKIKIGYKVSGSKELKRSYIDGVIFDWKDDGESKIGTYKRNFEDIVTAQLFLGYSGEVFQELSVTNYRMIKNIRHAIFNHLDGELDVIREYLKGEGKNKGKDFEQGVAYLLTMMGFSVAHLGDSGRFREAPDIIAVTSTGDVLIVECTVGHINHQHKISKLNLRANQLKEDLSISGNASTRVLPVLVTALSGKEIKSELYVAEKAEVAVVSGDVLDQWINNECKLILDTETVFSDIESLIPENELIKDNNHLF